MKKETKKKLLKTGIGSFSQLQRVPGAKFLPWFNPDKTDMRWLPINSEIELPGNSPLPVVLLDRLIEEASHRVIYKYCGCRRIYKCEQYPHDIGCLLMGDSALEGNPGAFREVGIEEAKAHAEKAVDAGLIPVIGKARIDNLIFGIKERERLLTTCFCCECCCITRYTRNAPVELLNPLFSRLDGLRIEVTDECNGCGKCVDHCYINAISVREGKAVIDDYCRGCGRCASVCPSAAITITIDDPESLDKALESIRAHVKYD